MRISESGVGFMNARTRQKGAFVVTPSPGVNESELARVMGPFTSSVS